jgi:hypothetical protein
MRVAAGNEKAEVTHYIISESLMCPSTLCALSLSFSSNLLEWSYTAEYCDEESVMLHVFKSEPFCYKSRFSENLRNL